MLKIFNQNLLLTGNIIYVAAKFKMFKTVARQLPTFSQLCILK